MSDTPIELKEIKPIGQFLLDSGKGVQTSTGCFYHYSDVCVLLRKFADRENAKLESELAEARAEIERLKAAVKTVQSAFKNYKNADAEIAKIEMREAKILAASCNSDSVNSERDANAILTDEIERKDKLIEQMRELLQSSVEDWAHKFNHDENPAHGGWAVQAGNILNELQALSAAERGEG